MKPIKLLTGLHKSSSIIMLLKSIQLCKKCYNEKP
jgi:hypothetical protein